MVQFNPDFKPGFSDYEKPPSAVEIGLRVESLDQKYHWYRIYLDSNDPGHDFEIIQGAIQNIDSWKSQEASLIKAKKEAKGSNQAKNNLLAAISHEIRTPLHGILRVTELLNREDLGSRAKSFVQIIQSSGDSLLTLVNDILDYSRIESGSIHLEESSFDLLELCEELQLEFFNRALMKELPLFLSYQSNIPSPLVEDPQRIKQILTNLIGNSIKFTKEGYILMEISLLEIQESGRIWVRMM